MQRCDSLHITSAQLIKKPRKTIFIKRIEPLSKRIQLPEEFIPDKRTRTSSQFSPINNGSAITQCLTITPHSQVASTISKISTSKSMSTSLALRRYLYRSLPVQVFIAKRRYHLPYVTSTAKKEPTSPMLIKSLYSPKSGISNVPSPINKSSRVFWPLQHRRSASVRRTPLEMADMGNMILVGKVISPKGMGSKRVM